MSALASVSLDGWASERALVAGPVRIRSLKMRSIWIVIPATVVGFGIGLGIAGCGSSTTGKDKMGGDKMSTDKMGGEKMNDGKMSGDKMGGDKMDGVKKDKM
jgi:hypothetical protein